MNNVNILFLGGGERVSIAEYLINSGKKLGVDVSVFAYETDNEEPISVIGKIISGKKWSDPNIEEHIAKVMIDNSINIVIPFVDIATILLAKIKQSEKKIFAPISDLKTNEIMMDKLLSHHYFVDNDFVVPNYTDTLPLIAKPIKGSGAEGNFVIRDLFDLSYFNHKFKKDDYFIQSFIDAIEYSVDAYVSQSGEIICVIPRKRIEVINGEVVKSVTINHKEIIQKSIDIINKLKLKGCITIQFLEDKITKQIFLMEINPRMGSGVVTTIGAGADITQLILEEYLSLSLSKPIWQENVTMSRYFKETFIYANNNLFR